MNLIVVSIISSKNMKTILAICTLLTAAAAAPQTGGVSTFKDVLLKQTRGGSRIISGQPAHLGQFPWQVALEVSGDIGSWFCGGILIHKQWVLTAAHCADRALIFFIRIGGITLDNQEEGRVEVFATEYYIHEGFDSFTLNNDVAIVKLETEVELNDRVQTVRLPKKGDRVGDKVRLTVSGWGKVSDNSVGVSRTLNFVELITISNKECEDIFTKVHVIDSTLCCRGFPEHSTCNGDSGGPLVDLSANPPTLVGVVSFISSMGCSFSYPSGYVRAESMLDWIEKHSGISL